MKHTCKAGTLKVGAFEQTQLSSAGSFFDGRAEIVETVAETSTDDDPIARAEVEDDLAGETIDAGLEVVWNVEALYILTESSGGPR